MVHRLRERRQNHAISPPSMMTFKYKTMLNNDVRDDVRNLVERIVSAVVAEDAELSCEISYLSSTPRMTTNRTSQNQPRSTNEPEAYKSLFGPAVSTTYPEITEVNNTPIDSEPTDSAGSKHLVLSETETDKLYSQDYNSDGLIVG